MEDRRKIAWVGSSVAFKGELLSNEDVVICGQFEGAIDVREHSLTIGPDADVRADIVGKTVIVQGHVKGQINASGKIHLHETASVEGDISSPTIVIAEGARVEVQVETLKRSPNAQAQAG